MTDGRALAESKSDAEKITVLAALIVVVAAAAVDASATAPPRVSRSEWVYFDDAGRLDYKTLATGDRIMDFSAAGYRGGGVSLPHVPVAKTVSHFPIDDPKDADAEDHSDAIQEAINTASALPLIDGIRGAVLLEPGTYRCGRTLVIRAGGVVLRGSGSGDGGTVIEMAGRPHVCIRVRGPEALPAAHDGVRITDGYIPAGADSFRVADVAAFEAGDDIVIRRPVTAAWVHLMGMDSLTRDGRRQMWVLEDEIPTRRTIRAVNGNRITLDVPLTDSFDAKLLDPPGASVVRAPASQRITEVGIESMRIRAPAVSVSIDQPLFRAVDMNAVADAWVRDVAIEDTVNSIHVNADAARVTLERVRITHRLPTRGTAKPADFTVSGTQVLLHRSESTGDNLFHVVTGPRTCGPNVVLHCTFGGDGRVQPHQRWATGLLVDNCRVDGGGIDFMNRGSMGSGHGWTIGWAVAWNCTARSFIIQQPPGSANWAVGCVGKLEDRPQPFGKLGRDPNLPRGTIDSHGSPVAAPKSLYLAQLLDRLGPKALETIGYSEGDVK